MDNKKIINDAKRLIGDTDVAFLATIDEKGFPQVRGLLNLLYAAHYPKQAEYIRKNGMEFETYFTTNMSSMKVDQIKNNCEASVYYREGCNCVLLMGKIELIEDRAVKNALWESDWKLYYKRGVTDPDYAILKFTPLSMKFYSNLEVNIIELK